MAAQPGVEGLGQSLTAALFAGVALSGGSGKIERTLIGLLFLSTLTSILKFGAHVYALGGNPAAALNGIYVVTLLLFIRFIFIAPYFFSSRNLVNILISASLAGIVTAGYTVAILAGQIETSTQGVLAVATVTTALLSVRVLTPVMFAASWVAARSAGLGLPLAVNRLARSSRTYRIPLLLLILTLALAVFTASLAQTMKRWQRNFSTASALT